MLLRPGSTVGPYEIVRQLGQGGMGVVYEVRDTRLKRTVAIKLLPSGLTSDEMAKQRFLQEAQAASALDHPNVCTIHDVGETHDGQLYLVMARYDGETLKERIARGPLPLDEAIDIATQVGLGLVEAHQAGIVHRDIKPANLFVTQAGVVKILDFGVAKLVGNEGVTQTGTTVGTVAYMSPEQARGETVDHRTDIWSLGVVLYEMLAGEPPFQGENLLSLAEAIRSGEPMPLAGEAAPLSQVLAPALSKDRSRRYQAVSDLLTALRSPSAPGAVSTADETELDVPSIAVLPFADMSPEKDQDYFCDGLAEELIDALARFDGFRVVGRTSSFQFRGRELDLREIGEKLGVETVLEGSVRKAGDRLRVNAQLINTEDGCHVWSERYDRELTDVFAVQDDIATAVAQKLHATLLGGSATQRSTRRKVSVKAYAHYLTARGHMRDWNEAGALEAIRHLSTRALRRRTLRRQTVTSCVQYGAPWPGAKPILWRGAKHSRPLHETTLFPMLIQRLRTVWRGMSKIGRAPTVSTGRPWHWGLSELIRTCSTQPRCS